MGEELTDSLDDDTDDEAMLMRTFELDGEETVDAFVWPPQEGKDGQDADCWYQITGMGDEKFRFARGVDGLQALTTALQFIALHLYNSEEYKAGRLTLHGARDLNLPEMPGLRFGEDGKEKAAVVTQGVGYSIVLLPQERYPRIAVDPHAFAQVIATAGAGESEPVKQLAKSLNTVREWYEAVCKTEGFTPPYKD